MIASATSLSADSSQLSSLAGPADGFALPLSLLPEAAAAVVEVAGQGGPPNTLPAQVGTLLQALTSRHSSDDTSSSSSSAAAAAAGAGTSSAAAAGVVAGAGKVKVKVAGDGNALRRLMDVGKEELLADEKALLGDVLGLLEEVVPEVSEWMAKFHARLADCAHGHAALWSIIVESYTMLLGKSCGNLWSKGLVRGGKATGGEIALLGDVLGLLEEVVPEVSEWMAKFHARLAACAHGHAAL